MEKKYKPQYKYKKENIVKISIDVKPELRKKFQETAIRNGEKPSTLIRKFIENYIKEEE